MLSKKYYLHQILFFIRNPRWKVRFALKIFHILMIALWLSNFALLSYFAASILKEVNPSCSPIKLANSGLIYYFIILFIVRFLLQKIPTQAVKPYLHLPINKNKIIHYFLGKSFFNMFNIAPIFLFLPFSFRTIPSVYSYYSALIWVAGILFFAFCNNFLIVFLKTQLCKNLKTTAGIFSVFFFIMVLNYFNIISLKYISLKIFNGLLNKSWYIIIPLIVFISIYIFDYLYLRSLIYLDKFGKKITRKQKSQNISFRNTSSEIGRMISLELKLIFRNRRPKGAFLGSFMFLLLAIIFILQACTGDFPSMLKKFNMFLGAFYLSSFIFNYSRLSLSWESSYFDFLISKNIDLKKIFVSKYIFNISAATLGFIVGSIPLIFINKEVIFIIFCFYLYNTGILIPSILLGSTRNPSRISIGESPFFNYHGADINIFLLCLIIPFLIVLPIQLITNSRLGFLIIGISGFCGLLSYKIWFNYILKKFNKRKYKIAENLRGQYS